MTGSSDCARQDSASILGPNRPRMLFYTFDANYCRRLREGDEDTGRHFVAYFRPMLLAKVGRRLRPASVVEDVVQEAFFRTFRALRSENGLREPEKLGAFVHSVCDNTMREQMRSNSRLQPSPEDVDARPSSGDSPEREFITHEREEMVREAIAELSRRDRQILRAVFFEERDYNEVSKEMGVTAGYFRVLLHRARGNFKKILSAKEPSAI